MVLGLRSACWRWERNISRTDGGNVRSCISIEENAKAMIKFLIANLIALILIIFIEPISLTIPKLMGLM